jgi:hypothetical protein
MFAVWRLECDLCIFLCFVDLRPFTILQINPTRCTILLSIFIYLLYMFRATTCPSSGEITVSMRHWYFWMASALLVGVKLQPADQTPSIQSDKSHGYSNFSWWWAHGCPKHVEKRNKYTKLNCAPSWINLQACCMQFDVLNVMYAMWCLKYDVWLVIFEMWCARCEVSSVMSEMWRMLCDICCLMLLMWRLQCGAEMWCLQFDMCVVTLAAWFLYTR